MASFYLSLMMHRALFAVASFFLFSFHLHSQSLKLKSPDEFLAYSHGSRFTPHHLLIDYFEHIAKGSDKVLLTQYGSSYELRPLVVAIVSSPKNLARLEEIRLNNLRRTGLIEGPVRKENIAIVHLSYSIHGDEAAGAESALSVLYELAKGGHHIDQWLENTVVIMDPCLNPDGYERYTQWNNSVSHHPINPSRDAREHNEPWPGGRTNHYYADLNRDWVWRSQLETRSRLDFYQSWMPHIHADLHEMFGSDSYYFAPAAQPYHPYLTKWQSDFQTDIGKNHASYFDRNGWLYFTKENFDLFYPSYGDTYPMLSGSIGMTYEQSDYGNGGRALIASTGDTLTLSERIAHHHTTSISTIETASRHANKLVEEFEKYFRDAVSRPQGTYQTFVIKSTNNKARIHDLLDLLKHHQIWFGILEEDHPDVQGWDYGSGEVKGYTPQQGDIIIPAAQPRSSLVQVLFEPEVTLDDSVTYDITAWSLPMAYGLATFATQHVLPYKRLDKIPAHQNQLSERPYAYAIEWGSVSAAKVLAIMVQRDITVRFALEAFRVDGKDFAPGTLLANRADNRNTSGFDMIMQQLAKEQKVSIDAISTGFVESGKDLGSNSFELVRKPSVLSIAGRGVHAQSIGQVWHFFEEELTYPITLAEPGQLENIVLHHYNVIILPEGTYNLSAELLQKLNAWSRAGGQLILLGSANQMVAGKEDYALQMKESGMTDKKKVEDPAHYPEAFNAGMRNAISGDIAGAVFRTVLDQSHPLAFGLGDTYWTLKTNPVPYNWLGAGRNAVYLDDHPVHYGFAGNHALARLPKSLVAGHEKKGSGGVVYLSDNPLFRSFWNSGKVLFSNALFF